MRVRRESHTDAPWSPYPAAGSLLVAVLSALPGLADAADGAAASALEEIIVTARKVEENLQETPVAISAFSAESLERRHITGTDDLDIVTPNLQFAAYSPLSGSNSAAQVFIRGIGQSDASGGVDPGVGLYIDDVYMGRSVGGVLDFRDIGSVQVLRGPQGTLFGRNTVGGAVLLSTRQPGNELAGEVQAGFGEDGLAELFAAADLPLGERAAARVSAGIRKRDGYVERVFDGIDLGDEDAYTLKGALHLGLADNLALVLRADYSEEDENGSPFVFAAINENAAFPAIQSVNAGCPGATFPPPAVPQGLVDSRCANDATWDLGKYTNGGTTAADSRLENTGFSAHLTWDVSPALTLKSITALRELDWRGSRDADNTPFVILSTVYESEQEQLSQEFQLLASGENYQGVVGFFYFDEQIDDLLRVPFGPPGPPPGLFPLDYQRADLDNESWALFTQWTYRLTPALSLTAGVRYTDETKEMGLIAWGAGVFPEPVTDPVGDPGPPPGSVADGLNIEPGPYKEDFSKTTGSLSVSYLLNDYSMVYLSWSQGFKSGGFNQRYNAPTDDFLPTAFDSEEAESWELGFKSDINRNLRLNAALFTTSYENMQLTYRAGIVPLLFNAGESSISGAELELTYASDDDLIVEATLGYLDDDIDEVAEIDFSIGGEEASATLGPDNDLPFTPDYQVSLSVSKGFALGRDLTLTPRVTAAWTDDYFFDTGNTEEVAADAETVIDASVALAGQDLWRLTVGVDNLTDNRYPVAGNSSLTTGSGYAEIIYARPRTYYMTGSYRF